ncbi:uncharacterized protein LOC110101662 isoform X2 [Dendrobium catenatum]|uniref:Nudix hydrolase domain-containing protein n=1 Tax=Dendrobium catenatum TaxID=906689 RepID=A0A2I0WIN4_9ASPA|nr:uncharacterized protein LOC110101662 isoform X2 [Dendrobium catenatum]PKU75502.1 hypothetical protein MA16_Dca011278 [Dendrobium catenatum]
MTLPPSRPFAGKLAAAFFSSLLPSPPPPDLLLIFAAALSFLIVVKNPFSTPPPRLNLRRRSLPPKAMSRTNPPRPTLVFSSPESLSDWLKPRLPPGALASWGTSPGTKTVNNLWIELSQGETSLFLPSPSQDRSFEASNLEEDEQQTIPLRAVHVAIVKIRNSRGALLVDSHQLLSDGTVRKRGRPLSEKMRPGETVEDAALRAVREELGIAASSSVKLVPGSYLVRVEEKASVSYPGLPARYILHSIEAQVESLPEEGEFSTEETGEGEVELSIGSAVFVRKHFWKWIDDYDGNSGSYFGNSSV